MRILSEPCPSGFAVFAASPPEMTPTARSLRRMRARMPSSATASAKAWTEDCSGVGAVVGGSVIFVFFFGGFVGGGSS